LPAEGAGGREVEGMKYKNFMELLDDMAGRFADRPAFLYDRCGEQKTLSYKELRAAVLAKSEELKKDPCTCVGVYFPACPEWVITVFASAIAGKRTVLLDVTMPANKLQLLIHATGVDKLVSYDEEVTDPLELCKTPEGPIEHGGCILFFTSGTTSLNKAVVISQKALCSSAWNGQQCLPCSEKDIVLCVLPLNHVFGFVCAMFWPLNNGATVAFGRGIRELMEDPKYFKPTIISVVPTILKYFMATQALNPELRCILIGASPCDQATFDAITATGVEVRCGYGLTETASGLAMTPVGGDRLAMDLCPDTQVRLADDGEVMIRTTCMMEGYYHDKASTDQVLRGGELATGDLGELDENGRLHILGRKNDVLVLPNGEKIYCTDAEAELSRRMKGESALTIVDGKITLIVSSMDRTLEQLWPQVDEWNKDQPMGQRIAQLYVTEDKLPKTATGKLQRWKLHRLLED